MDIFLKNCAIFFSFYIQIMIHMQAYDIDEL